MQTRGSLDARQMSISSLFWKFVHFEVGGMFSKKEKEKGRKCFIVSSLIRLLIDRVEAEEECSNQ